MERYINTDKDVIKYIHDDGSETSLKTAPGCSGRSDKLVAFISSSVGCRMKCKMCYLTTKGVAYKPILSESICKNTLDALNDSIVFLPLKPLKLSFMGMGEILSEVKIHELYNIITAIFDSQHSAFGVDGIDIGTCLPNNLYYDYPGNSQFFPFLFALKEDILKFLNNNKIQISKNFSLKTGGLNNSFLRMFYSLHSVNDDVRKWLIPNSVNVAGMAQTIKDTIFYGLTPVIHYTLLDGINDSIKDCIDLLNFIKYHRFHDVQIRILTYNKCPNSVLNPSKRADEFVEMLSNYHEYVKYQVSPGKEVVSACGMFIGRK